MALTNNDTFRRLGYALKISDARMQEFFALGQVPLSAGEIDALQKKDTDPDFKECADYQLAAFLDGMILALRGPRDGAAPTPPPKPGLRLSNNDILKKLRIALEFKEEDIIQILLRGERPISPTELRALFRQPDHRNFKPCGDQILRNFLTGLEGYRKI